MSYASLPQPLLHSIGRCTYQLTQSLAWDICRVAISSKKGVPRFRPSLPLPAVFSLNDAFADYLYHKCMAMLVAMC
jgi:hypothetical protein